MLTIFNYLFLGVYVLFSSFQVDPFGDIKLERDAECFRGKLQQIMLSVA
jgi:hypothetical protein